MWRLKDVSSTVSSDTEKPATSVWAGIRQVFVSRLAGRFSAVALFILAVGAGILTIVFLNTAPTVESSSETVALLLYLDLAILLLLGTVIAHRTYRLWAQRRSGVAGSRLHIKFTLLFACVAVTPAILVALFSLIFIRYGGEAWVGDKVQTAISESLHVAEAYLEAVSYTHLRSHETGLDL